MTTGWVDVMPETEFGVWFALFYALAGSILIYVRACVCMCAYVCVCMCLYVRVPPHAGGIPATIPHTTIPV